MALHSFYIKNPSAIPDLKEHAKKAIMDRDPGVMCASLQVFHELIKVSSVKGSHWFGKIKREVCQHVYQRFHHKKLSMVMSTQKINKLQFCLWNSKLHNCTSKSRPLILVMNNLLFYCTRSITIIVIIGSQYTENDTWAYNDVEFLFEFNTRREILYLQATMYYFVYYINIKLTRRSWLNSLSKRECVGIHSWH